MVSLPGQDQRANPLSADVNQGNHIHNQGNREGLPLLYTMWFCRPIGGMASLPGQLKGQSLAVALGALSIL